MRYHVAVGTHQKTGTVWMNDVFQQLGEAIGRPYKNISRLARDKAEDHIRKLLRKKDQPRILFHNHSEYPDLVRKDAFRGLHLVRDPRDIVISAIRYHESTDAKWANAPKSEFGGKSLREAVCALPTVEDKILFEIEHVAARNISPMAQFDGGEVFLDIRYEDLVQDHELRLTAGILQFLGFDEFETLLGLISFWKNSLYGQKRFVRSNHIRDGSARQFERVYSDAALEAFDRKFSRELDLLGYDRADRCHDSEALAGSELPPTVERARQSFAAEGDRAMETAARLAIDLRPDSPLGFIQLARILRADGRPTEAEGLILDALDQTGDSKALLNYHRSLTAKT